MKYPRKYHPLPSSIRRGRQRRGSVARRVNGSQSLTTDVIICDFGYFDEQCGTAAQGGLVKGEDRKGAGRGWTCNIRLKEDR